MTDSDIQIDEEPQAPKPKSKGSIPAWMVAIVIITFVCYTAVLWVKFLEYQYLRGGSASESDPYAAQVVIPAA